MHPFVSLFGRQFASYGICIATGLIIANLIAGYIVKKSRSLDINDLIIVEAYALLGGGIGAKALYIAVTFAVSVLSGTFTSETFQQMMKGGFVFYGGLFGGLGAILICRRIHGIDIGQYIEKLVFLLPFVHGFGRIGCFMAGCCYGVEYSGPGAVIFPKLSFAPGGISLFPIQIVESCLLFCISLALYLLGRKKYTVSIETYLIMYAPVRFVLEFFRNDNLRGVFFGLSTSQWISLIIMVVCGAHLISKKLQKIIEGNR